MGDRSADSRRVLCPTAKFVSCKHSHGGVDWWISSSPYIHRQCLRVEKTSHSHLVMLYSGAQRATVRPLPPRGLSGEEEKLHRDHRATNWLEEL